MKKRTTSKGSRAKLWLGVLACATVLACGFFFAARQHFSSIDFGMKNSRLRKQIDDLESEKRRLLLAREVSLSPTELKKAAVKAKVAVTNAISTEMASLTSRDKSPTPQPVKASVKPADSNPLIVKTVATSATAPKPVKASAQKPGSRPTTVDHKLIAQRSAAE